MIINLHFLIATLQICYLSTSDVMNCLSFIYKYNDNYIIFSNQCIRLIVHSLTELLQAGH